MSNRFVNFKKCQIGRGSNRHKIENQKLIWQNQNFSDFFDTKLKLKDLLDTFSSLGTYLTNLKV